MTDPSTMTVAQLKEALKTRGLDATGLKAALVARLRAALESSDADAEANDDTPAADPTDEKATTPAKSDPPLAKAVSESIEKKKRKRGRGGEDAEAGDDADDAKDEDEDEDGEKEAKAPRKDADADAATAAAAVPEIEMPPVTIDPNTGKASIEINVKGNEGRVIGKGGETIRHMERKFNCKIEMRRDRGTCLVTGPENVMRDAVEYIAQVIENGDVSKNERAVVTNTGYVGPETPASMIAKIVADARAKIDSGEDAAASDFPDVLKGSDADEPVAIEVPCPGQEGRVIGRGGATIKEIERQSGAVAKVSKGTGRCDVNGPRGKVTLARRIVLEVMALPTDPFAAQASQAGKREVGDWLCPQCGANVFRSKTACFSCGAPKPFEAYGMPQQPMGGPPGGGYAQQAPMGAPQMGYGMQQQQQQQGYGMPMGAPPQPMMNMGVGGMGNYGGHGGGGAKAVIEVPCMGSEGRIIGKGGDMIKYIQTATNTKLDMKRDKGTVQVTGTPEAVAAAEAMVREVIENGDTREKGGLLPPANLGQGGGGGGYGAVGAGMQQAQGGGYGMPPPGQVQMVAVPVQGYGQPMQAQGYGQQMMMAVPAQPPQGGQQYAQYAQQAPGAQGQYAYVDPNQVQGAVYVPAQQTQPAQTQQPGAQAVAGAEWGQARAQAAAPAMTGDSISTAPSGGEWQTHYSEGRAYYYNTATGETRWA